MIGLYIHIPFCKRKCNYCDFCSFPKKESKVEAYVKCVNKEIKMMAEKYSNEAVDTVFIGGGTPSFIGSKHIVSIMKNIRKHFKVTEDAEISIEMNPGTVNEEKLKDYMQCGISRISIGLQATQEKLLNILGRIHTYDEFLNTYKLSRKMGFKNINVDLIFGLPEQTLKNWETTLNKVIKLKPEHVSCYSLIIEEGTPFFKMQDKLKLPTDEQEREMYHKAKSILKEAGYNHYEISNFALPGYECEHNVRYWKCKQYIGVGLSAHSYMNNVRWHNTNDLDKYINFFTNPNGTNDVQIIDKRNTLKDNISEFIFMRLRLVQGLSKLDFLETFDADVMEIYGIAIRNLIEQGLMFENGEFIALTEKGLDLANQVMMEFV